MTNEISIIEREISPIAQKAVELEIVDDISLKTGVELLSRLNIYNDNIENEKNKVLRPLLDATKAERGRWKPLENLYQTAIDAIRGKMTLYQTEQVKARKEAEDAIARRIGAGKGHLKVETAVTKLENLPTVEKEHATEVGLVQFREKKVLKITDKTLLPDEYWHVNEELLLEDLKKGITIPGAEIEIQQIPVNYR